MPTAILLPNNHIAECNDSTPNQHGNVTISIELYIIKTTSILFARILAINLTKNVKAWNLIKYRLFIWVIAEFKYKLKMVVWQRASKIYTICIHHDQLTGVDMTCWKIFGCTLSLSLPLFSNFSISFMDLNFYLVIRGKKKWQIKSFNIMHTQYTCLRFFSVWNSAFQFNLVSYKYWTGTYVECFHILKFDLVVFDAPEMAISDKMFETCMCKHLRISWIMAMT